MIKYIGIGLPKSGTRSLREAFDILGYKTGKGYISTKKIDRFEFVNDGLTSIYYPKYFRHFPSVRLVYTLRDYDKWLNSSSKAFSAKRETITRKKIFGAYKFDEQLWKEAYLKSLSALDHFRALYPDDVLVIDIDDDDKWNKICSFTGDKVPDIEFPWRGRRFS